MKKILMLIVFTGLLCSQNEVERTGLASASQLLVPVSASAIAMGTSVVATAEGIDALYYNVAGIIGPTEAGISYQKWIADISMSYFAAVLSMENSSIALSVSTMGSGDIQQTTWDDKEGTSLPKYQANFTVMTLGYAVRLTDKIAGGVAFKSIAEKYKSIDGSAFALDAGIKYKFSNEVNIGISLRNLGTTMSFSGDGLRRELVGKHDDSNAKIKQYNVNTKTGNLPFAFNLGVSYKSELDDQNSLMYSFDFGVMSQAVNELTNLGIEYNYNDLFMIRGGYNLTSLYDENELRNYSFGFGLFFESGSTIFRLDYSYQNWTKYFSPPNMVSLKVSF